MNLATAKALLLAVVMLLGKSAGTPLQPQATALAQSAVAIVEQWAASQDIQPIQGASTPELGDAASLQVTLPSDQAPQPEILATSTDNPDAATTMQAESVRFDNGAAITGSGVQTDYACTMKTCHWDISQEAQLGSWNLSTPDASRLTGLTVTLDPGIAPYVSGVQVYVGSQLWSSADGEAWTGSADLGPSKETSVTIEGTLLPGATAQFASAVTVGGFQGTDEATGGPLQ